ncbi:MAG TPA: WD40 repeat domain-containing protein [Gemmataceae bacterium]
MPPGTVARLGDYRFWHGGTITSAAVSPDGKILASGGAWDRWHRPQLQGICLWEMSSGKKLREIFTPAGPINCLCFSADGKTLAAGCGSFVCLWDATTGKERLRYKEHKTEICLLRFTEKQRNFFSGEKDGSVHQWDATTGRRLREWKPWKDEPPTRKDGQPAEICQHVALAPDGKTLWWTIGTDEEGWRGRRTLLRVSDISAGKVVREIKDAPSGIRKVMFSSDSQFFTTLVEGPWDYLPLSDHLLWDTAGGTVRSDLLSALHTRTSERIPAMAFSPDVSTIAYISDSDYDSIRLWDVKTRSQRQRLPYYRDNHLALPKGTVLVFSPDSKRLVMSQEKDLMVWDVTSARQRRLSRRWPIHRLVFSPDGRTVMASNWIDRLARWDTATWKEIDRVEGWPTPEKENVLAISPDGRRVLTQPCDTIVLLCESRTLRPLHAIRVRKHYSVQGVAFSLDGRLMMLNDRDNNDDHHIRLFDVNTGEEWRHLILRSRPAHPFLSPDGATLGYFANDNAIHLLDTMAGKEVHRFDLKEPSEGLPSGNVELVFSAGGAYLAAAIGWGKPKENYHCQIRVWRVKSGEEVGHWLVPPQRDESAHIGEMTLSPDGRTLAASQWDAHTIRLWETASGQECRRLEGHRDSVSALAFSAEGKTLVSGSQDSTVLVWDVRRPNERRKSELTAEELTSLWTALAADAHRAEEAIRQLAYAPKQSVPFLKEHLRPAASVAPEKIQHLLRDLDSEKFEVREQASGELEQRGEAVEADLRKCLKDRPSLEVRRRIEKILAQLNEYHLPSDTLRALRALACLEYMGVKDARLVIESLSRGSPEARLTREATAAMDRLNRKTSAGP